MTEAIALTASSTIAMWFRELANWFDEEKILVIVLVIVLLVGIGAIVAGFALEFKKRSDIRDCIASGHEPIACKLAYGGCE